MARSLLSPNAMHLALPLTLLLVVGCTPAALTEGPCEADGDLVVVATRARVLWLCSQRRPLARIGVALGRGGVDKTREGDGRTPLGLYALGTPRASARFGTFIPIGYPTDRQKDQGFTGRDVGIHGPDRRFAWLGALSTRVDWTAGCIATGSDEDLAAIASFVRARRPHVLVR